MILPLKNYFLISNVHIYPLGPDHKTGSHLVGLG
jgi:hypothetical protein